MKFIRKPIVTSLILLAILSAVYFMTTSSNEGSLGKASPINLQKQSVMQQLEEKTQLDLNTPEGVSEKVLENEDVKIVDENSINTKEQVDESLPEFTETPFMPKMTNETLKAQLGNAAWKLFHTILARYPEKPTALEESTLSSYIQLFAQVYPCGDCARHFQKLLSKYPPQTKSRITASVWGCDIHNKVNERLKKPTYDCSTILEDYDCGCGSDELESDNTLGEETIDHLRNIKVNEKEDELQLGG